MFVIFVFSHFVWSFMSASETWGFYDHYPKIKYNNKGLSAHSLPFPSLSFHSFLFFKQDRSCDSLWASCCFCNLLNSSPPSDSPPPPSHKLLASCHMPAAATNSLTFSFFVFFFLYILHHMSAQEHAYTHTLARSNRIFISNYDQHL